MINHISKIENRYISISLSYISKIVTNSLFVKETTSTVLGYVIKLITRFCLRRMFQLLIGKNQLLSIEMRIFAYFRTIYIL